jgi:tRNA G10  N-methylase Trm11
MSKQIRHPAKYTDSFIGLFAELLNGKKRVLDPFAGTGKIGLIKNFGFNGEIYANEIEPEWINKNEYCCDYITNVDAEFLNYPSCFFDAICTSPTYGNRMADHHEAKDGTRRNTYTHCIGRQLSYGNTGKMQWGIEYMKKHERIYKHLATLVEEKGIFICNIKNHIRQGKEIDVKSFHENAIINCGFTKKQEIFIETKGNGFGANANKRTNGEYILVFEKG